MMEESFSSVKMWYNVFMKKLRLILALFVLTGCAKPADTTYQRYSARTTEVGFDTVITFLAYTKSEQEFQAIFETVKSEYAHYNKLFDRYNDYPGIANIKTINDNAGKNPIKVDPAITTMITLAKEYAEISEGYFDISLGPVLDIWHDYREKGIVLNGEEKLGEIPSMAALNEANKYVGMKFVDINQAQNTIFLNDVHARIDVGAIAKGYATELIAQKLEKEGVTNAVISGGGNIRTINQKPDNQPWAIGIEKPSLVVKNDSLDIFKIPESMSIVTSGDYQRYYYGPENVKYSHLVNKDTLMPAQTYQSLTVITKDSGMADALSTALYMMPHEKGIAFINDFNTRFPDRKIDAVWIHEGDTPAAWYHKDGFSFTMTKNLEAYSKYITEEK